MDDTIIEKEVEEIKIQTKPKDEKKKAEIKEKLLTDENYKLIFKAQKKVSTFTGFSPSYKRMINEIINENSIDQAVGKLIEKLG